MQRIMDELRERWQGMFAALGTGEDLPPGLRLRTEGMMEAAVLLGAATEEELMFAMESCFGEPFRCQLMDAFNDDWRDFFPFPQIPAVMLRAPVYPSTQD